MGCRMQGGPDGADEGRLIRGCADAADAGIVSGVMLAAMMHGRKHGYVLLKLRSSRVIWRNASLIPVAGAALVAS